MVRSSVSWAAKLAGLGLLVAVLSGCQTVGGGDWNWSRLARQCEADRRAVWLEPRPASLAKLLVLSDVTDPATTGGELHPLGGLGWEGEEYKWFQRTGLRQVFVYMHPRTSRPADDNTFLFGPYDGEPEGVYQWDELPSDRPECRPWLDWLKARNEMVRRRGFTGQERDERPSTCIAYAYRGPVRLADYDYIYVNWWDRTVEGAHVYRLVEELRRGPDHVIARAVNYGGGDDLRWAPECFHTSESSRQWFPGAPS